MKAWIASDLHIGPGSHWFPAIPQHDVMVIAGDVAGDHVDTLLQLHAMSRWSDVPIVFVPGNHDYFGGRIDKWDGEHKRLLEAGVHVLSSGQAIEIQGVRFVGATLWTDFALAGDGYAAQAWAAKHMPEYQAVKQVDGDDLIWPAHVAAEHERHRAAIEQVLSTPFFGPTVVVTHHAPSPRSVQGRPGIEDAAYASNLEEVVWQWQPELWIHGHIHRAVDYRIGGSRVLSNPRGFFREGWSEDSGFDEGLVIDV